jgi:hypothetical protein
MNLPMKMQVAEKSSNESNESDTSADEAKKQHQNIAWHDDDLVGTTEVLDETYEAISELTHQKTIPSKSSPFGMSREATGDSLEGGGNDAVPLFSFGVATWRASS